jgi:hypothetical protein
VPQLSTTSSLRTGILIDMKEHANGFPSIKISETGKKVAYQDFFGYLQILDAENQFYPNFLSIKTSKIRTLV